MPWFPPVQLAFRTLVGVTHWANYIFHNPRYLKGRVLVAVPAAGVASGPRFNGRGRADRAPNRTLTAEWLAQLQAGFSEVWRRPRLPAIRMPARLYWEWDWRREHIAVLVYWTSAEVTGNVRWRVRARAVAEGENWNESSRMGRRGERNRRGAGYGG